MLHFTLILLFTVRTNYERIRIFVSLVSFPALMFSKCDSAGEMSKAGDPSARAIPDQRLARCIIIRPFLETKPAAWGVVDDTIGKAGGVSRSLQ